MGKLRNLLIGGLATLTLSTASMEAKATPTIKKPKLELKVKKRKHPAFQIQHPKKKKEISNVMIYKGSRTGSLTRLDYSIPKGVTLKTDGKIWFKNLSFDIQNEVFLNKLVFYTNQDHLLQNTPLDEVGKSILNINNIGKIPVGDYLTVHDFLNSYRLLYDLFKSSWNENTFKTKGSLDAKTKSFSEIYISHLFELGKDIIRYDHGIRYGINATGNIKLKGTFKFGEGLNLGIHPLEKYFGSVFDINFSYNILADLTASETHEFSHKIPHGWQGIGIEYQEFYRSKMTEKLKINAQATKEQLSKFNLASVFSDERSTNKSEQGNSYLLYLFRQQDFGNAWYYGMLGASHKRYKINDKANIRLDEITIDIFGKMNSKTSIKSHEIDGMKKVDNIFNYAFAGGIALTKEFQIYGGISNYPHMKKIGGIFLHAPYFIANINLESSGYMNDKIKPRMEFFIPLLNKGEKATPLMQYFKEKTINFVNPFSTPDSKTENSKRRALSKLQGLFLNGEISDEKARLSVIGNLGKKFFFEFGLESRFEGVNISTYTRMGYKTYGILLEYGVRNNKAKNMKGHVGSAGFFGDFGRDAYFQLITKGLWFERESGYLHTPHGLIVPRHEQQGMLIIGGYLPNSF